MQSLSLLANNAIELAQLVNQSVRNTFRPTLAIVFSNPAVNPKDLYAIFQSHRIDMVGCSSAGEITDGQLNTNKISVLLVDIPQAHYHLKIIKNEQKIYATAIQIAEFAKKTFTNPSLLVFSGGISNDGEAIVEGINTIVNNTFPVFGGLAGDNLQMLKTSVFYNEKCYEDGLVGLVFNDEFIEMQGIAESGWAAIGGTHKVTKAKSNILYEINGEPAVSVFSRYFGSFDGSNDNDNPVQSMSAQYPLQIQRANDYSVLRAPMFANADGSVTLVGAVKDGEIFRFSMSPGFEVIDETIDKIGNWKTDKTAEADALIMVSCKGRHAAFGPLLEDEVTGVYNTWKKPMVGFLSYGEIGSLRGKSCDFHNETCCLITLKSRI